MKPIRVSFTAFAGWVAIANSVFFLIRWIYWLCFSSTYVYDYPHMPVSVGLLMLALGISLVKLSQNSFFIPRMVGLVSALIAYLDLSYDLFRVGVDIDQVLSLIFYGNPQFRFLHMAPNSAVVAICSSLAIFLLAQKERKDSTVFFADLLGGLVAAVSLVSIFGHSAGMVSAYTWKNFVGMSVYTAVPFSLIGFAICFHALESISFRKRQIHAPLLVAFSFMAITLQFYRAQTDAEFRAVQASTVDHASTFGSQLSEKFNEHIFSLRRMGKLWDSENGNREQVWRSEASEYLANLSGFTNICWANSKGEGKWCSPDLEKIDISGITLSEVMSAPENFLLKVNREVPATLSALVPVSKSGRFDGVMVGIIHLDTMIDRSFDFSAYALVLEQGSQVLFRSTEKNSENEWTQGIPLLVEGVPFLMKVTPLPNQISKYQSKVPIFFFCFGMLFSCFIAYGTFLFIITRENARLHQDRLAWEQAISTGSDLIFVTFEGDGMVKSFNPAAEKFFEYGAKEVVDVNTPLLWHVPSEIADYATRLSAELGRKILPTIDALIAKTEKGGIDRNEWTFITKTKVEKKGELSIHPLHDGRDETVGYVGIVRDMTEQREAEAKLVQSSKMASLGEMASGVAHEINNPLTIIQGRATRLLQLSTRTEGVTMDLLREHLGSIGDMTRRIAKIVKGLETFSRNAANDELEPAELSQILQNTLELCREKFEENKVNLEVGFCPEVVLSCRPTEISQVLLNLINNAFDAVQTASDKWVKVDVVADSLANRVQISVIDSGSGIPDEVYVKIMQPFFTTKEVGKGTGLGLSISKGIVEGHRGTIFLDRASVHTRFVVELPTL